MSETAEKLYDAFISYSSQDSEVATRLANALEQADFRIWLDKREVLVGHNIVDRVNFGISESRFMIVLLSSSSVQSEWVKREWTAAHITEIESKDVVILPVLVEPCEIPQVLRSKRYADLAAWDTGLHDVLSAIERHGSDTAQPENQPIQVRRKIISSPVHFATTPSHKAISDLFIGGVLFTGLPKSKIRNTSLLMRIGNRISVTVNLDQEDVFMMGGINFGDGLAWKWDQDCESIPCMILCVDPISGEHSRQILPTYYQVRRVVERQREVIFLFLLEDSSRADVVGIGIGPFGWNPVELRSAHISSDV